MMRSSDVDEEELNRVLRRPGAKFGLYGFSKQKAELRKKMSKIAYEIKGADDPAAMWRLERKVDRVDREMHEMAEEGRNGSPPLYPHPPPPPSGGGVGMLFVIGAVAAGIYWYGNQQDAVAEYSSRIAPSADRGTYQEAAATEDSTPQAGVPVAAKVDSGP